MQTYRLLAPAKINLYLEILGDRADGYHELAMVMQSVSLSDRVSLRANGTEQVRVTCSDPQVPTDASNLAHKAAALMQQTFPQRFQQWGGVDIAIDKQIPIGAGLAGGSADAAAVLVGLDLMWELGLTQSELQELAAKLGSDIPFCVSGGTAIATGRGEQLAALRSFNHGFVVLAKYRDIAISTPWAYQTYRSQFGQTYVSEPQGLAERRQRIHSGDLVGALSQQNIRAIGDRLHNDLEKVVLPAHPRVAELRQKLSELAPLGAMMSGSGSTVFGLAESQAEADRVAQQLRQTLPDPKLGIWTAQTIGHGVQLAQPG